MSIYIIITLLTCLISLYLKKNTKKLLLKDLKKNKIAIENLDNKDIDKLLTKEIFSIKSIHYLIPGTNILVALLFHFSYYLNRLAILNQIIKQDTTLNIDGFIPNVDVPNLELENNEHIAKILDIEEEKENLLTLKGNLIAQKEIGLKLHK